MPRFAVFSAAALLATAAAPAPAAAAPGVVKELVVSAGKWARKSATSEHGTLHAIGEGTLDGLVVHPLTESVKAKLQGGPEDRKQPPKAFDPNRVLVAPH